MRKRLSRVVNQRFPRLSWNIWSARRSISQISFDQTRPAIRNARSRLAVSVSKGASRPSSSSRDKETRLLLVIPAADHEELSWGPAHGNYSYELHQTACAYLGSDSVRTLRISSGQPTREYHQEILSYIHDHGITHVLSRIDIEANAGSHWSWDLFVRDLRAQSQATYLPLTYDSAYPYVSMHLDRLTRL